MITEDADFSAAKGETSTTDTSRISKAVSSSSTTSWSRLKDPRIVRVSRAFGGKDRHSKVCTVRGLRDRRVRLSVPTAIQLYDLQDRLGLNQPSKVVDWLLNEAKHAIDELPPLQIPQGSLMNSQSLHHHPMFMSDTHHHHHHHEFLSPQSESEITWGKGKDVSGETSSHRHEDWGGRNQEEGRSQLQLMMHDQNQSGFSSSTMSSFLSRQGVSFPSLLNGSLPHSNPFLRWDPSNMTPQRSHESSTSHSNDEDLRHHHSFSLVQLPSIPSGSHPVLVYHQTGVSSTHSFDSGPSHISGTNTEFESKQAVDLHSLQLSNSSLTSPIESDSQPIRPFQFTMTANLLPSQNSAVDEQNNHNQFHSS